MGNPLYLPGGFGSRNGAAWTKAWAADSRRSERGRARHRSASIQDAVTPPSRDAIRRAIRAQLCPFCGSGPYASLGAHTNRAHGVSAADLRDASGLKSICSEDLSAKSRARLEARPDRGEISSRGGVRSIRSQVEAGRPLADVSAGPKRDKRSARDPIIARRAASGDRLVDIAADLGVSTMTVRKALNRMGLKPTLARTNAERRDRLRAFQSPARAAKVRRDVVVAEARLRRWQELGGTWEAIATLSVEFGTSEKTMRAYLRKWGAAVPDGRMRGSDG